MKSIIGILALLLVALGPPAVPAPPPATSLSREEIETIVREYILKHLDVLEDLVARARRK